MSYLRRPLLIVWICLMSTSPLSSAAAASETPPAVLDYPVPAPAEDTADWGRHIQRTMHLLASSTPEQRNRVRVMFYGQSITDHKWWPVAVIEDLRRRFPHAIIEWENRAIGGFSSQYLVKTAEQDLYPYYPDLLIFHVFGAHNTYEDIIERTRSRTAAEVAIWTDHVNRRADRGPDAKDERFDDGGWTGFMSRFLPRVAARYDCELIEIREPWKRYLRTNDLTAGDLLRDNVHPNDHGQFLIAELIKRQLVHRPERMTEPSRNLVRTLKVGRDVEWEDGRLTLTFTGNRVDALAAPGADGSREAKVLIDGQPPSRFNGCYAFTRPSDTLGVAWPAIWRVGSDALRRPETWTVRLTKVNDDVSEVEFELHGSKTGFDGRGVSTEPFVSDSGRVTIQPEDWGLKRSYDHALKRGRALEQVTPQPGFEITFEAVALHVDRYAPQAPDDPTTEHATTLAQGLPAGEHTLEIISADGEPLPIEALRVHRPPFAEASPESPRRVDDPADVRLDQRTREEISDPDRRD